jgi:heme/copper-type cytochrome/quinol oxidase subunit 3
MTEHLHKLSAVLFYALGSSFFGAYLLFDNALYAPWPAWWLSVGDLPLILCGMLYGGSSLYRSVKHPKSTSRILILVISIPLAALFIFLALLNYWELLGLPGPAA